MAKPDQKIDEMEEKNAQDGRWLFNKLQEVADLAKSRDLNTYVASYTFLMFANSLNRHLAPDSQIATAVSLRVLADQLNEEHESNQAEEEGEEYPEEQTNVAGVPTGATLH